MVISNVNISTVQYFCHFLGVELPNQPHYQAILAKDFAFISGGFIPAATRNPQALQEALPYTNQTRNEQIAAD